MSRYQIGFANGDHIVTGFRGNLAEAEAYFLNNDFNIGTVDDDIQTCNSVIKLMTRRERAKIMRTQRMYGIMMLALCAFILFMCSTGVTPEDKNATAVLLIAPIGLIMLFSKNIWIYG